MPIPGIASGGTPGAAGGQRQMMMQNIPPGVPPEMLQQFMQMMGGQQQEQQATNTREVKWLVAIEGNVPLKIVATSQKGGTAVREITLR